MASNDVIGENSNASGGDDNFSKASKTVRINSMVLLVQIEHVDGRPVGPDMLTESTFRELCQCIHSSYEPYAIEILSPHEICVTYRHGVSLGQVAGELMVIESQRDLPILVTMVIIKRSKVDAIFKARQKYRKEQKDRDLKDLEMLKQGQCDLHKEMGQVTAQKEALKRRMQDHDVTQRDLLKTVEQLTEKVTKLEMQPLHAQGFLTSSSQNVSTFGNLSTSFQVKANIDIGKFSGTEPTPTDKLNFDQWCIDVKSYQAMPTLTISYYQQSENRLLVRSNWS